VAVISCGALNEYGHPHSETVKRLSVFTDHIFRTDEVGSVRVYSDGERLWVQSER
jgi:competence protein ComEC